MHALALDALAPSSEPFIEQRISLTSSVCRGGDRAGSDAVVRPCGGDAAVLGPPQHCGGRPLPCRGPRSSTSPLASAPSRGNLLRAARLGGQGLSQPHPLQRARQGRPVRRLRAGSALLHRGCATASAGCTEHRRRVEGVGAFQWSGGPPAISMARRKPSPSRLRSARLSGPLLNSISRCSSVSCGVRLRISTTRWRATSLSPFNA